MTYLEHFAQLTKVGEVSAGRDIAPSTYVAEVECAIGGELPEPFRKFLLHFPRTSFFFDPMLRTPSGRSFHGGHGTGLAVSVIFGDSQQESVELGSVTRSTTSDKSRYGDWAADFIVIGESIWGDSIMLAVAGDDAGIVCVFNVWGRESDVSGSHRQHMIPVASSFDEFIIALAPHSEPGARS